MIVTRKRRRRVDPRRILIPLAVVAAVAFALWFPPSRRLIADGPLHPAWAAAATAGGVVERPFTFAAQQQTIADRNRQIRDLDDQLETERRAKADAQTRSHDLEHRLGTLANQPREAPSADPTPAPTQPPGAAGGLAATGGTRAASDGERRLAATWASMEPEKAAAVIQRLPDDEVTRVLGQMDADSAGAIMNALPPAVAARISSAGAQVSADGGR